MSQNPVLAPERPENRSAAAVHIPHECAPVAPHRPKSPPRAGRLDGIDLARALAVLGMFAVHLVPQEASQGGMSLAFVLSSGKAAALFAVLAGVGIALSTGRERRPRGRGWLGAMVEVSIRGLLIGVLGLALGQLITADYVNIILVYYAALFLLAIPLLRLPVKALAATAVILGVGMPVLSHVLRQGLPVIPITNPSFTTLAQDPQGTLTALLLTGAFPALSWLAYLAAGLAVGRSNLLKRGVMARITGIGIFLAVTASALSWYLMERLGGLQVLANAVAGSRTSAELPDLLVWGAAGTVPTNSPWWLAVLAPHTSTPFDLLFTMGIALAVIGLCLVLCLVTHPPRPLLTFGSMPLTMYTVHLLLLEVPWLPEDSWLTFVVHVMVLFTFALVWRRFARRGPLEQVLYWASSSAGIAVGSRTRTGRAATGGRHVEAVSTGRS